MIGFGAGAAPFAADEKDHAVSAEHTPRLARLIEEQYAFVWRLLRRIGVTESDADDAAQQVFISASQRLLEIRPGSERAFLFGVAVRVGSRARRSHARKREQYGVDLEGQIDPTPGSDELLERRRAREVLDALLGEMPLDLRVVFALYEIEQLTSAEIAEVVGIPLGTVASRLRRAREDFAARLARFEAKNQRSSEP